MYTCGNGIMPQGILYSIAVLFFLFLFNFFGGGGGSARITDMTVIILCLIFSIYISHKYGHSCK